MIFQEHDHEAEQIISSLSLNTEDDDLDIGKFIIRQVLALRNVYLILHFLTEK